MNIVHLSGGAFGGEWRELAEFDEHGAVTLLDEAGGWIYKIQDLEATELVALFSGMAE